MRIPSSLLFLTLSLVNGELMASEEGQLARIIKELTQKTQAVENKFVEVYSAKLSKEVDEFVLKNPLDTSRKKFAFLIMASSFNKKAWSVATEKTEWKYVWMARTPKDWKAAWEGASEVVWSIVRRVVILRNSSFNRSWTNAETKAKEMASEALKDVSNTDQETIVLEHLLNNAQKIFQEIYTAGLILEGASYPEETLTALDNPEEWANLRNFYVDQLTAQSRLFIDPFLKHLP